MKILVADSFTETQKNVFVDKFPNIEFTFKNKYEAVPEDIKDVEAIIGFVHPLLLREAKDLKWYQLTSSGSDSFCAKSIYVNDVILTNASGAYGPAISEYMIGALFSMLNNLHIYRDNQYDRLWQNVGQVQSITDLTTLILGVGDIGGNFAKKIHALGGKTIGVNRVNTNKPDYLDQLYLVDKLDELLPQADIVALCLPSTKDTYKILNKERLELLKENSIVINVGRGNAIDTQNLCKMLDIGRLNGAIVDVTDPEPLPSNHRLWTHKNAIVTPHIAGAYNLSATVERVINICTENIENYINKKPLKNEIDFQTGYKKPLS